MTAFIARRSIWMLMVLFVVSIVTFIFMHQVPGSPFDSERPLNASVREKLNEKYNLDQPLWRQYVDYVAGIAIPTVTTETEVRSTQNDYLVNIKVPLTDDTHFRWMNFGPSMDSPGRSVNDIFRDNLPVSFQLGLGALLVACAIGIPLGTLAAMRRNTFIDYMGMGISILGVSIPIITLGPLLRYVVGVQLGWLPTTGWGDIEQMIMPAFALGFASSALLARLTRASLLQVLGEDYIRTARAKGLNEQTVIIRHTMKNAMIPVVTVIGPLFAALVTGTFVAEQVFAIPGMGRYFITSVNNRDYPVIMGTILLYASFLVFANFVVDIVYAWLDPRIRLA